ncbi:hypothetical protein QE390_001891 [Siphonobacter sp. SORGH_AS 1065]|nr:hypothetical protein [Siphonobacter sp. SORGH_AS_1065]
MQMYARKKGFVKSRVKKVTVFFTQVISQANKYLKINNLFLENIFKKSI